MRPRLSFFRLRAHTPSTRRPTMLSVAGTRRRKKSGAIIASPDEKYGLSPGEKVRKRQAAPAGPLQTTRKCCNSSIGWNRILTHIVWGQCKNSVKRRHARVIAPNGLSVLLNELHPDVRYAFFSTGRLQMEFLKIYLRILKSWFSFLKHQVNNGKCDSPRSLNYYLSFLYWK